MLTKFQTGIELQVHTDAHGLWYGAARHRPQLWKGTLYDFVRTDLVRQSKTLMLLGTKENAELITTLYYIRVNEGRLPRRVWIGSPNLIGSCNNSMTVRFVSMRELHCAGSVGGWHELTRKDFLTYALIAELQRNGISEDAEKLVQSHPTWTVFSFLPDPKPKIACALIEQLVDPRWYVDLREPDEHERLFNFLGLKSAVHMRAAINPSADMTKMSPTARRTCLVAGAWLRKPDELAGHNGYFHEQSLKSKHKIQGLVAASRLFVEMLVAVWRHELALPGRELFVPRHFFDSASAAEAFQQHWDANLCRKGA